VAAGSGRTPRRRARRPQQRVAASVLERVVWSLDGTVDAGPARARGEPEAGGRHGGRTDPGGHGPGAERGRRIEAEAGGMIDVMRGSGGFSYALHMCIRVDRKPGHRSGAPFTYIHAYISYRSNIYPRRRPRPSMHLHHGPSESPRGSPQHRPRRNARNAGAPGWGARTSRRGPRRGRESSEAHRTTAARAPCSRMRPDSHGHRFSNDIT
jgi:hypothetical protein